jgi:hypothetical protein
LKEILLSLQNYGDQPNSVCSNAGKFCLSVCKLWMCIGMKESFVDASYWDFVWGQKFWNWGKFDLDFDREYVKGILRKVLMFMSWRILEAFEGN